MDEIAAASSVWSGETGSFFLFLCERTGRAVFIASWKEQCSLSAEWRRSTGHGGHGNAARKFIKRVCKVLVLVSFCYISSFCCQFFSNLHLSLARSQVDFETHTKGLKLNGVFDRDSEGVIYVLHPSGSPKSAHLARMSFWLRRMSPSFFFTETPSIQWFSKSQKSRITKKKGKNRSWLWWRKSNKTRPPPKKQLWSWVAPQ